MAYAIRVENGVAKQIVKARNAPPGWVASDDKVAIGSTYSGGVFTPPDPPAPPTPAEIEAEVQNIADALSNGGERDKAIALLIADVVARAFGISAQEARQMVRDRLVKHLRDIRGI